MSDDFCPRQITFELAGSPGVIVTATERNGAIDFIIDVNDTTSSTADLRALFFHFNEAKLPDLEITSTNPLLTESRIARNSVLDLGDGATLAGAVKSGFDVGLEWGTPGGKKDDINFAVDFTLSNASGNLTLDDFATMQFGAKLDSVGGPGGPRRGATKLLAFAPWAPDAKDDYKELYEDGASGYLSPSKTPQGVVIDVLENDFDGDGDPLTILNVFHDGPSHGTVELIDNGTKLLYTPDLDYAGLDSFEYCISDGHGGQDSATVSIKVFAVADKPTFTYDVAQGANINEMLITVTAAQDDADSSEFLDRIVAGALPAGITLTPTSENPAGEPDTIQKQFKLTTPAKTDVDFDLTLTAYSAETSNGDTEQASLVIPIEINFTHNETQQTFQTQGQSVWQSGSGEPWRDDPFLGLENFSLNQTDIVIPLPAPYEIPNPFGPNIPILVDVDTSGSVTVGLSTQIEVDLGQVGANLDMKAVLDTTFNKVTDTILVEPGSFLIGGNFKTTDFKASLAVAFDFDLDLDYSIGILGLSDIIEEILDFPASISGSFHPEAQHKPLIEISTDDLTEWEWDILPGIVKLKLEWPHYAIDSSTLSDTGVSDNIIDLALDVEGAAINSFPLLLPIDENIYGEDAWQKELLDTDLNIGAKIVQEIAITASKFENAKLVLEDLTEIDLDFSQPLTITNASSHDLDHDGIVTMKVALVPGAQLENDTMIDINAGFQLQLLKNFISDMVMWDSGHQELSIADITIFDDPPFDLNGFTPYTWSGISA